MKRVLATLVTVIIMAGLLQACSMQTAQTATQGSEKVIKDPAEYNVYMTAFNTRDPAQRGALMEKFVSDYPDSVVRLDALELAMSDFQRTLNLPKAEAVATQIIKTNPDYLSALLVLAYARRDEASQSADPRRAQSVATEGQKFAEHALQLLPNAPPPAGVTGDDWIKQCAKMSAVFYGAAAFGALQNKDYAKARDYYAKALAIDSTSLQDVYQIGIAELALTPPDINGLWHIAKAASMAQATNNAVAAKAFAKYGQARYTVFHGSSDGWEEFAAKAASEPAPPPVAELRKRVPTPCDIAVQAVNDAVKTDGLGDLSFSDYEFVLQKRDCSPENKQAADVVWKYILDKQKNGEIKIRLQSVKVMAAAVDSLDVSLTDENQAANKADLHVVFEKPLARPPEVNSMIDVIGVIADYQPEPFMFTMAKGELPATGAPGPKPRAGAKPKSSSVRAVRRKPAA